MISERGIGNDVDGSDPGLFLLNWGNPRNINSGYSCSWRHTDRASPDHKSEYYRLNQLFSWHVYIQIIMNF
jgi:hypothetical protein